jgi:hypothetical protein
MIQRKIRLNVTIAETALGGLATKGQTLLNAQDMHTNG